MRRFVRGIVIGLLVLPLGLGMLSWWRSHRTGLPIRIY